MEHRSIKLTLEDGSEITCEVLTIFKAADREYIALVKPDEDFVLLYRFMEDEEGPLLENIESDEEFQEAEKVFREVEKDLIEKQKEHHHHHDHDHGSCCGHDHSEEKDPEPENCCSNGDDQKNGHGCGCS